MATTTILLNWVDLSMTEKGFRVYKSNEPFDVENRPSPLTTLPPNTESYSDSSVEYGKTYYYMVSVFNDTDESFSPLKKVICREDIILSGHNTDFHMVDSTGDAFDVFKTNVRFPGITESYFQVDVFGNYYVYEHQGGSNYFISKYNSSFEKEWSIGLNAITRTYFDIGLDGRLYIYTMNTVRNKHGSSIASNGFFVFDKDGEFIARLSTTPANTGTCLIGISPDPDIVYVYNGTTSLSRLDIKDTSILTRSISTNSFNSIHGLFVDRDFNVYMCGSTITRYSHDLEELASFSNSTNYAGGVITNDGSTIITGRNASIRMYDAKTLTRIDQIPTSGSVYGIALDSNNDIYALMANSYVEKISFETKEVLWTYTPANGGSHTNLLIRPGRVYHNFGLSGVKGEPL